LNERLVADLKTKLSLSESKQTDIRLEALSSVHQIAQLRDYLDNLKVRNYIFIENRSEKNDKKRRNSKSYYWQSRS
jgi:hypothetical protein